MIEGYIGVPGAGKTLSMTVRAFKERKLYDEIITNYTLKFPKNSPPIKHFTDAESLLRLLGNALDNRDGKRRLVLIDEVHLIFDARAWSKVPMEFLRILAQPRKASLDMLYTAQHESQVEKRLRVVTNYLHLCQSWGESLSFWLARPLIFWSTCYESFTFRGHQDYGKKIYRFKKRFGRLYDTMEVLQRMDLDGIGTAVSPPERV